MDQIQIESYLKRIGKHTSPMTHHILTMYKEVKIYLPAAAIKIFISDMSEYGTNLSEQSLWFFSKYYAVEIRRFMGPSYDYKYIVLKHKVSKWRIKTGDYKALKNNDNARFDITVTLLTDDSFILRAIGRNCRILDNITRTIIIPNRAVT